MKLISIQIKQIALLSCTILFLGACSGDGITIFNEDNEDQNIELLAPNIKYQESYEEISMTFGLYWPSYLIENSAKISSSTNSQILLDYENVLKTMGFDEEGNMIKSYSLIEGSFSMDMPENLYEDIKDRMPARDNTGEIGSYLMKDGMISYYDLQGNLLHEYGYSSHEYKINPEYLDSMYIDTTQSLETKIQKNIEILESSNVNFQIIETDYAIVNSISAENNLEYEKLIDLKTGLEIQTAVKLPNGDYESVTALSYKVVNGIPIMRSSETLKFGMENGSWDVVEKHVISRKNIQVIIN